ncbi:MAG TPA: ABC transporter permease subunit/CPBP intramembrane protease [Gemmataceae bacterium]|nr:ABC transporter permease subunit/CPBP intramembrane protease [Gemmataceae bacterium]
MLPWGVPGMRWSIISLIFVRELRDQLRDRRTILMIAVLPMLLYPVLGMAVVQFAVGLADKPGTVGIVGSDFLPVLGPRSAGFSPLPATAWLTVTPASSFGAAALPMCPIAAALALGQLQAREQQYPPLLVNGKLPSELFKSPVEARLLRVALLDSDARTPLDTKQVDLIVFVPSDFSSKLQADGCPVLRLSYRQTDDRSRLAVRRFQGVFDRWLLLTRETRLLRHGLAADFDDPVQLHDDEKAKPTEEVAAQGLLDLMVRVFPFLLVMWSLAGALYPAVDLCAGEKERGTMETLLISPASREEIVWGKFLTIWLFSAATALLNLGSMGLTTSHFSGMLSPGVLRPAAIFWCVLLALPLSAFFSAVSLAVGAYARSSKEGQYYLMPLFLITMPLIFLTLVPGVELNPFYSLVPVTGVALLIQRLMTSSLDQVPWLYFIPVLVPVFLYSLLALRWAIEQFKREEVLFREAERLDLRLWIQRLFREKDFLPSTGQAFFCFGLIVALRWLSFGGDAQGSLVARTSIIYLAFVTTPPLFMAMLLTTRPRLGLGLSIPPLKTFLSAVLLAGLMLPPLSELTLAILRQFPVLKELLSERQPLVEELSSIRGGGGASSWLYLVVFALLPAICEELAFRGFILSGLRRRFAPWTAILMSSFLFAIYHMNVFQALPAFILGVVLSLLTIQSGSTLPAMLLHLLYNGALIGVALLPRLGYSGDDVPFQEIFNPVVTVLFSLSAVVLLARLGLRLSTKEAGPTPPDLPHQVPLATPGQPAVS